MKNLLRIWPGLLVLLVFTGSAAGQSVLQSGEWYKIAVTANGVYKIDYHFLRKMGVNPDRIDPRKIRIHGYSGGMLPQPNSATRIVDLPELAIQVTGEDDGRFNRNDAVLFYAEGPDRIVFKPAQQAFEYQNNLYSDKNFYFLCIGDDNGKRLETSPDTEGTYPTISEFDDYFYHETDTHNELHSGREWFGEKLGLTPELKLSFKVAGIVGGSNLKIVSAVMGQTYSSASFKLFYNNTQITEQHTLPISSARYALKGQYRKDTIVVNANSVNASSADAQEVRYQFVKGSGFSQGYIDHILVNMKRALRLYGNQTIFTSGVSLSNAVSTFDVAGTSDATVWDITDPANASAQVYHSTAGGLSFSTTTTELKKFIVFNNQFAAPEFIEKIGNQNLHGLSTPNLLIISHPLFTGEAERLAAHRQSQNWLVHIVTVNEIYHEFSSGRQDITAIRDFVKFLYDKNPGTLKAVLLMGKCSYDYKDRIPNNTNYVPTYESRNALHPLQTYSSDDYFGFLENSEGDWQEDPPQHHTLDIGIGRLPVQTVAEAKNIIDKLIRYDTDKGAMAYWRKEFTFVADDGSLDDGFTSLHQLQANDLAEFVEYTTPGIDTRKLFLGTYQKVLKPSGETVPALSDDIVRTFEKGSLIINYTGHGSEKVWADERVFTDQVIAGLQNKLYPFLVTATCEFGRHDDPTETSSAEQCVTLKNAGAIGLVTTTRPVNATTNFNLNIAFYDALLQKSNNRYPSIGDVFRLTKNNSMSGTANRNFSLLGDPSLTLALPNYNVAVTSLQTATGSDVLKALSTVTVRGEIQNDNGEKLTTFSGTLQGTLFDKKTSFTTLGRNDPSFSYQQWHNALFRGMANVASGEFEFRFIVPKNIAYTIGDGKFSFYAADTKQHIDAHGATHNFEVGSTEENVAPDHTAPVIRLFMGDTTFVNGGITSSDTYLVATLSDASGINISSYGIGNNIVAILDNDAQVYVLNDYYCAYPNDYTRGMIRYPLKDLAPGKHTLTVKAWDTHNNPAQATVDFIVTDGEQLQIETFGNYPNPFSTETTLFFTHNRSGDDLDTEVYLYSVAGELIKAIRLPVLASDYRVDIMKLDNSDSADKKLPAGVYLARIIVRSVTNGSKNEHVTKLVILN